MASDTGGVKAFSLQGRLYRERERLAGKGMTQAERAWRAQWIKDQQLSPCEPVHVPELEKELRNLIKRLYRYPMDCLEKALQPKIGKLSAYLIRHSISKTFIFFSVVYSSAYYFKYNANDWTRKGGWRVFQSRRIVLPGDSGYQQEPTRSIGSDYSDRGFKNSPI